MVNITLKRTISAPAETVFETITDHSRYPDFTPIRKVELEQEGSEAPNGAGAIRALHFFGQPIREEIVTYEPPRTFAYKVLSGVPVRSQVGTVTLTDLGGGASGGTAMKYELEIEPSIPLSGPFVRAGVKAAIGRLMAGVGAEAERRARPAS